MASTRIVLSSLVVIGAIAAMVTAATMAVFSDQVISDGNTFAAGTLYMSVDGECGDRTQGGGGDGGGTACNLASVAFNLTNMTPGDSTSHTYEIVNEGTLPGTLTVDETIDDAEGCFSVVVGDPASSSLAANDGSDGGPDETTVLVTVSVPNDAGNGCQGDAGTLTVTFNLDQQA